MDFLVNDLSLHGQYHDIHAFRRALAKVMDIRAVAQRFDSPLYCHRNVLNAEIGPGMALRQAVGSLPRAQRSAVLQWLTRHGPFWDDLRRHGPDDWLEWRGEIATDTAVGEAAFFRILGEEKALVSFAPSKFQATPIRVDYRQEESLTTVDIPNYWEPEAVRQTLRATPPRPQSWAKVERMARARFDALHISRNAFLPLNGHPFANGAAQRIIVILSTLDRLHRSFDAHGNRTMEGHEIYQQFFTGRKEGKGRGSVFSDSSDTEKSRYRAKLTFPHPALAGASLFCPWHGKVQTPQFRVHFSTPITADQPLYVVYIGPKITAR